MKRFLTNKLNIVLSLLLLLDLTTIVLLVKSLGINEIKAIDFTGYQKSEVENWLYTNEIDLSKYHYDYSYDDETEENEVIYQSIKPGATIDQDFSIIYSKGKEN